MPPLHTVLKHINLLRDEEAKDGCWFILPEEGDDDVNWMDFTVEIEGPEVYLVNPVKGSDGPRESPYKGGLFRVSVKIPDDYPMSAPTFKFLTKVWHPQVDVAEGKICSDVITESWKPSGGLKPALEVLRSLLASPEATGQNSEAVSQLAGDVDAFEATVREWVEKYAKE